MFWERWFLLALDPTSEALNKQTRSCGASGRTAALEGEGVYGDSTRQHRGPGRKGEKTPARLRSCTPVLAHASDWEAAGVEVRGSFAAGNRVLGKRGSGR